MIPYARHMVDDDDAAAVLRVLRSDRLTQGPLVEKFEAAVAAIAGTHFAVATSSGTTALWCAANARLNDVLLRVSPFTFVATIAATHEARGHVKFADVDDETLCLPPGSMPHIGPFGSIGVDYAGYAAPGEPSLIDAAHSFGVRKGRSACFSFHPSKLITTGEGGAFVTDDAEWAASARALRDHGRVDGAAVAVGTNARMSDIHAALGLSQIGKAGRFIDRRRQIAQAYMGEWCNISGLRLPHTCDPHAWHLFVVRVPAARRDAFRQALADRGVSTQIHYRLVYEHPAFAHLRPVDGCPVAERAAAEVVSLPLFPAMTDTEIAQVVDAVRTTCKEVL